MQVLNDDKLDPKGHRYEMACANAVASVLLRLSLYSRPLRFRTVDMLYQPRFYAVLDKSMASARSLDLTVPLGSWVSPTASDAGSRPLMCTLTAPALALHVC